MAPNGLIAVPWVWRKRLRPERGAKPPSESAWGWGPTRSEKRPDVVRMRSIWALTTFLAVATPAAAQNVHLLVVVGLAGDPEHAELFQRWASTLVDGATGSLGIPARA